MAAWLLMATPIEYMFPQPARYPTFDHRGVVSVITAGQHSTLMIRSGMGG